MRIFVSITTLRDAFQFSISLCVNKYPLRFPSERPCLEYHMAYWLASYWKDVIKLEKIIKEIDQDVTQTCKVESLGEVG